MGATVPKVPNHIAHAWHERIKAHVRADKLLLDAVVMFKADRRDAAYRTSENAYAMQAQADRDFLKAVKAEWHKRFKVKKYPHSLAWTLTTWVAYSPECITEYHLTRTLRPKPLKENKY